MPPKRRIPNRQPRYNGTGVPDGVISCGDMKLFILMVGWCLLFLLCWPLALLALVLFPLVWLISFPLRLIGITLEAAFAFLTALLFLPARLLGYRRRALHR
jgi:hypothetical protein